MDQTKAYEDGRVNVRLSSPIIAGMIAVACAPTNQPRQAPVPVEVKKRTELDLIPECYRGYWGMTAGDGQPLPYPYLHYDLSLPEKPAECALLRDKGISRGVLAKGATVQLESDTVLIRFDRDNLLQLALHLPRSPEHGASVKGHVTISHQDTIELDCDIFLEPRPRP